MKAMKKTNKTLMTICVVTMLTVLSCSKDSGNNQTTTTVAEDKQHITSTFNDFYSCLNALDDGDLSNFMLYSLFNATNNTYNDSYLKSLSNQFENQFGKMVINDKFQFATRTGVYTYNSTIQVWTRQSNSSGITLLFPSTASQSTPDSELTLSTYNDTYTSYNSQSYWVPNAASLQLKRNGTTVFSLNLSNVTFDTSTNFTMPTNMDLTVFTAPFTHTFHWGRVSSTEFQLTYNSSTPQGCGTSSVTNVKLYDADYGNITSVKDDVKLVNGTLTEGNLKVVYAINVQGLAPYSDPTPNQINSNADAEVFYNNQKIGDLTYTKVNDKVEIFIVYTDGTSENVNTYVGDFETRVRSIFSRFL